MIRRLQAHEWWLDGVLAALFGLLLLMTFDALAPAGNAGAYAVALATAVGAVLVRRASPAGALALASVSAVLQMLALATPGPVNIAQAAVVYACSAYGSRRVRGSALAAAIGGALVATGYLELRTRVVLGESMADSGPMQIVFVLALVLLTLGCAWLLGLARALTLRSASARVAQRVAEVEQRQLQERMTVEAERGRIAREMHDVLAHSLVVIATLADGARYTVRDDAETTDEALRSIGDVSRESLSDVRRVLAELRHEQSAAPAATFDDLPALVAQFGALGLRVDASASGERESLTTGVSHAAYRAVQEALTNALRHGAGRRARLAVAWAPGVLSIEVANRVADGPARESEGARAADARTAADAGHGLVGMRERVLLEAGSFSAGRRGEEFRVALRLPTGLAERLPAETPSGSVSAPAPASESRTAETADAAAPAGDHEERPRA